MTKTIKGQNNILREQTKTILTPAQSSRMDEILGSGKAPESFSLSRELKPEDISLDSVKSLSDQSFALWAVTSGATVDGHKVDFDKHRYLLPIYMDNSKEIAWIKAAQLGATVYMLLRSVWWLTVNQGRKAGLYFPNKEMVEMLSQDRLNPMLKSIPDVWNLIQDTEDQANRMTMKKIGASTFYLFHLGGKASKDSVPLDFVTFDEVRLCNSQDIDQALERISHSSHKYKIFMSTAGMPNNDIHARFLQGSQHVWRVKCGCFPYTEKIWVRNKNTGVVSTQSFQDLQHTWSNYEALSMGSHKTLQWKSITAFHHNGEREVIESSFRNGQKVLSTPDHVFFRQMKNNGSRGRVQEIAIGDVPLGNPYKNKLLCVSHIPTKQKPLEKQVPYDNETLFVLGAYIAEGSSPGPMQFDIAQFKDTKIREVVPVWARKNNIPCNIQERVLRLSLVTRPDLAELFYACGTGCENKHIPASVLEGTPAQLQHVLHGYLVGDGHDATTHLVDSRGYADNVVWSCATTSRVLAEQIQYIGLRIGTPVYTCYREPVGKKPVWYLQYNPESTFATNLVGPGISQVSIRKQEAVGSLPVCDITVEDNHNYVLASGLLAHNCSDGCDLPSTWPECVVEHPTKGLYLRCPKCGWQIKDTQNGRYVPMNDSASFHSYRASQLNSKFISLREIWDSYLRTTNMKEFYNAKLGLPYIDEENQPIKQEHLDAAVDPTLAWAEPFRGTGTTAMGVDQGAGYCFAIIADMHEGKKRIRHVELIESDNPNYRDIQGGKLSPFIRLRELMQEYNVRVCVCDAMPNANDALAFAQDFPGRVWLAFYTQGGTSPVQWKDRIKTPPAVQKAGPFLKFKYIAFLNRYLSMDAGLNAWVLGDVVTPEPRALIQTARGEQSGRWEPEHPLERVHAHLKRLVRQFDVTNEETGEGKMVWVYAGKDPHLAHAWCYCNVALERLKRQVSFVFA